MEICGTAHNGQDCLTMLETVNPDVLVLDIIMPHLDGLAVLGKIQEMGTKAISKRHHVNCIWSRRCHEESG